MEKEFFQASLLTIFESLEYFKLKTGDHGRYCFLTIDRVIIKTFLHK